MMLHNVLNCLAWNNNLVWLERNLSLNLGNQILLSDLRLVLFSVAIRVNTIHPVKENWIDSGLIIVAENKQTLAQIKIYF
jgi:hypothetical protein